MGFSLTNVDISLQEENSATVERTRRLERTPSVNFSSGLEQRPVIVVVMTGMEYTDGDNGKDA